MRIFSKYHDYYDSVMAYGVDPKCVYVRNEEEYIVTYPNSPVEYSLLANNKYISNRLKTFQAWENSSDSFDRLQIGEAFLLLFCGKLYPCIVFYPPLKSRRDFWYPERFKKYCYTLDEALHVRDTYPTKKKKRYVFNSLSDERLMEFYNVLDEIGIDIHYETGIPSFLIKCDKVVYNPILKPLRFGKVMDSFTTFQTLAMFISGVLGGTSPPMVEISDDIRLQKHGFDLKTSFRNIK